MNDDELKGIWKEAVVASSSYYPGICLQGILSIVGVAGEIRTEHLRNTSMERYRYADLPGV
jgi:hypothetical protein